MTRTTNSVACTRACSTATTRTSSTAFRCVPSHQGGCGCALFLLTWPQEAVYIVNMTNDPQCKKTTCGGDTLSIHWHTLHVQLRPLVV
jgi:hypothetical protein